MIDFNEISAISKTWNYRKTEDRNGTEDSFTVPEYSEKLKLKKIGGKSVVWNQLVNEGAVLTVTGRKYLSKSADVFSIINGGQSVSVDKLIDLTKLFGAGNEPTSTTDPRITAIKKYLETHPEYNEGEIVDSLIDEIELDGVNLLDESLLSDFNNYTERSFYNGAYTAMKINVPNGEYKFTTKHKSNYVSGMSNTVFFITPINTTEATTTGLNFEHVTTSSKNVDVSYTLTVDNEELFISVYGNQFNSDTIKKWLNCIEIQISKSSTPHPYKPYTAPKIIEANFPSLKSAGSVYDYIDFTSAVKLDDGNYAVNVVRNVGQVDLGSLNWYYFDQNIYPYLFKTNFFENIMPVKGELLNCKYTRTTVTTWDDIGDKNITHMTAPIFTVRDDDFSNNLNGFRNSLEGQILYYELATPIIETITVSAELLEWLKVEYGGNMYYNQDGLSLPIPNITSIHKHIEKTEELSQIVINDEVVWSAPLSMFNLYDDDDIIIDEETPTDDETSVNEDEVIENE